MAHTVIILLEPIGDFRVRAGLYDYGDMFVLEPIYGPESFIPPEGVLHA